ncbi:fused MFS/spermidine synthase [Tumidithrix elongata RA019]|uniref:Fused MFS/spermidine synthase n=1 Tax=Tumidithrix elongata BACA0141 TaxID=2716417 RepID=A0AAW9PT01_9CYAN|nr:fused MFS/spermidine synthase [Tumidithrix elongata RA019]
MVTDLKSWQTQNRAAIAQRLEGIGEIEQQYCCFEPSGVHFIAVNKEESLLQLALFDQINLSSELMQSEIDLKEPLKLTSFYAQAMLLGLVWQPQPQRIYIAGFGGGRIPLVLHHYFPNLQIECTEIDPTIVQVAQEFFGVKLDSRLQVAIQDGRAYLADLDLTVSYDLIMADVILGNGYAPYRMATVEFYQLCQKRLSQGGIAIVNLIQKDPFYLEKIRTIHSAFQHIYLCPLEKGNTAIFATNQPLRSRLEIIEQATQIDSEHQFAFPFVDRAQQIITPDQIHEYLPDLEKAQILTDEEPPQDYFAQLPSFKTVFAKVNPELPCPCGSGSLYQDCHGKPTL